MSVSAGQQQRTRSFPLSQPALIGVVAAAAGAVAASAPGEPTGIVAWDTALKCVLAVALVLAGSKAQRWVAIAMATIAAAFAGLTLWALAAWIGLALAIGAALLRRRNRVIGALAAGLAVQTLLRLPAIVFFGFSSLVAAIGCTLMLVGGYRYASRRQRQFARRSVGALTALLSIVLLLGAAALLNARADIDTGVAAARRGLAAGRSGDTATVSQELARAEVALESANERASGTSARLLRLVPVAAQHQRAIEAATSAGARVARDASAAVTEADFSDLSLSSGSVDLNALQTIAPQLRETASSLESALVTLEEADSPWILPPLRDRVDELALEIEELQPEIELAADATEILPSMLGLGTPDTYLVMFGTPAESREMGGFIGSWALVRFDNGALQIGESGRIAELYEISRRSAIDPQTVSPWFLDMARPTRFPQNLTSSPDFAQVAAAADQVIGGVSDVPLSGFIYLDPSAVVDLLELTGPVQIPFGDEPLSVANAERFFNEEQYRLDTERTEVFDVLAQVAATVVERMRQQVLPGPEELGRVMGPAARGGHLQVVTFDDEQNEFLRSVKLLRDFGQSGTSDFVALVQTNGLSNKMDLYLERALSYEAVVGDDGTITAVATATLRSVVPPDAPEFTLGRGEESGVNRVLLSLYSPHNLTSVTVNGAPVETRSVAEFGLGRYLVTVDVPATGAAQVVRYELSGSIGPGEEYALEVWHQPLVNTDSVSVFVDADPGGKPATGDFPVTWMGPLAENQIVSALQQQSGS